MGLLAIVGMYLKAQSVASQSHSATIPHVRSAIYCATRLQLYAKPKVHEIGIAKQLL